MMLTIQDPPRAPSAGLQAQHTACPTIPNTTRAVFLIFPQLICHTWGKERAQTSKKSQAKHGPNPSGCSQRGKTQPLPKEPPRLLAAPVIRSGAAPLCRLFPGLRVPAGGCNVLFSLGSRTVCPGSLPAFLRGAGAGQGVPGAEELLRPRSKPGHEAFIPPVPCVPQQNPFAAWRLREEMLLSREKEKKEMRQKEKKKEFFWLHRARRRPVSRRDGWHTCAHTHAHACAAPWGGGKLGMFAATLCLLT